MRRIQLETPYKWIIDTGVVSLHVRNDFRATVEHQYKLSYLCARTPYCAKKTEPNLAVMFRMLLTSPLRALQIAFKKNCPNMVWVYPLIRLYQLNVDLHYRE